MSTPTLLRPDYATGGSTIDPSPQGAREVVLDYARRVFERQRVPLPPAGFQVDWSDQPSRHKLYLDTPKLPLPPPFEDIASVTVPTALANAQAEATLAPMPGGQLLASVLGCYGLIDRRLNLNWNEDSTRKLQAHNAVWSRPTASGGGMYPVESYLIADHRGPLPTGVYHYDTAHHSLDRLSVRHRCDALAAATGVAAGLYLVATVRLWKNAFKYNSFSYHVVIQDIGALLASWRLVLGASGVAVQPVLWFDEAAVSAVVGVDGYTEAPFVVVPLGPTAPHASSAGPPDWRFAPDAARQQRWQVWERSRRVRDFELVQRVHAAALVGDRPRPDPGVSALGAAHASVPSCDGNIGTVALPASAPATHDLDLGASLRKRRSSFGLFSSRPALTLEDLGWVLTAAGRIGCCGTDVAPATRSDPWVRLWVVPNNVVGLEPRAYAYDPNSHRLCGGPPVEVSSLQRHYTLINYNLREVAAILVVTGRLDPLVAGYGAPGYRMLGVEVGQAAQGCYVAATARGLGVGAVLGIDNLAIDDLLGISRTDERSLLFLLLGHERADLTGYHHALYRSVGNRQVSQVSPVGANR